MGFGECCCTCLKGFCAIPVGGLIAVAGICLGGIMGLSGLDDAAAVLEGMGPVSYTHLTLPTILLV